MSTSTTWTTSTIDVSNAGHVPRLLYSRGQAAFLLSICVRTLDTLVLTKELRCVRIGRGIRIPAAELEKFCKRDHSTVN
jgi:excisionase family DNA binding protein